MLPGDAKRKKDAEGPVVRPGKLSMSACDAKAYLVRLDKTRVAHGKMTLCYNLRADENGLTPVF